MVAEGYLATATYWNVRVILLCKPIASTCRKLVKPGESEQITALQASGVVPSQLCT